MTQEEKQLLLADLCARLPYGVKVTWDGKHPLTVTPHIYCAIVSENNINNLPKLLLRPMSFITEEEMDKIEEILGDKCIFDFMGNGDIVLHNGHFTQKTLSALYDFYNSIHVDYHTDDEGKTMIEKGLALEAPKGMYKQTRE